VAVQGQGDAEGGEHRGAGVGDAGLERGDDRRVPGPGDQDVLGVPADRRGGRGEDGQGRDGSGEPGQAAGVAVPRRERGPAGWLGCTVHVLLPPPRSPPGAAFLDQLI